MNSKISFVIGYGLGAITGAAGAYYLIKKKIEERVDAEINEVVDRFKERIDEIEEKARLAGIDVDSEYVQNDDENDVTVEVTDVKDSKSQAEYNKQKIEEIIKKQKHNQNNDEEDKEESKNTPKPYIISEDEYGESGNDESNLMYYADKILADDYDNIVSDPEEVVGDALKEFDKDPYLECLYVRDDSVEIDYVILKSEKSYKEINQNDEE